MQVIYNYPYWAPLALLHQLSTAIGMILFLAFIFWLARTNASTDRTDRIVMHFIGYPVLLLFFVIALIMGYENFQDWRCINAQVSAGEIKVAEGEVTDYDYEAASQKNGTRDDFYVDGVHFVYGSADLTVPVGYRENAQDGGYIRQDGQYVRISYITLQNGRNIILRIEAPISE